MGSAVKDYFLKKNRFFLDPFPKMKKKQNSLQTHEEEDGERGQPRKVLSIESLVVETR